VVYLEWQEVEVFPESLEVEVYLELQEEVVYLEWVVGEVLKLESIPLSY